MECRLAAGVRGPSVGKSLAVGSWPVYVSLGPALACYCA